MKFNMILPVGSRPDVWPCLDQGFCGARAECAASSGERAVSSYVGGTLSPTGGGGCATNA
jgi:hypothetical protein